MGGRGVVEHFGCDVNDVDIMMGTFTKSFGGAGGYIAASKDIIDRIRSHSHSQRYATSMSPAVCQQVISAMRIIMGEDGTTNGQERIKALARNSTYFRQAAQKMGLIVYGNDASPVIPMLIFHPAKIAATPIVESRVRFCISASHTRAQLDQTLQALSETTVLLNMKYSRKYPARNFHEIKHLAAAAADKI